MSVLTETRELLDRENPGHDTCPFCRQLLDIALYGRPMRSPEEVARELDGFCKDHKQAVDDLLGRMVREIREKRGER